MGTMTLVSVVFILGMFLLSCFIKSILLNAGVLCLMVWVALTADVPWVAYAAVFVIFWCVVSSVAIAIGKRKAR